jgi:hypothetical protein
MTSKLVEDITWDPVDDDRYVHNLEDQDIDIARRVAMGMAPMTPPRDSFETMKLVFAAEESADRSQLIKVDDLTAVNDRVLMRN